MATPVVHVLVTGDLVGFLVDLKLPSFYIIDDDGEVEIDAYHV